jgi:hypothetical protein
MSNAIPHLPVEGPGQDDCGRLLLHLQVDYIRDLRLEVGFYELGRAGRGLKLEVLDDRPEGVDGKSVVNVWAIKTFGQRISNISTNEIYDLLMTAYRTIDRFFELGEAFAPTRREK